MKPILILMAGTAMLSLAACKSEAPAPAAEETAAVAEATATAAAGNSMVGGAEMFADKPIAANASAAPNLTTLVAAVTQAGLVETLAGPGPFTVFAPTNAAFAKLPAGTVDTLLQPANKAMLTSVLTYHVVPGRVSAADLVAQIQAGGGKASLTTVNGGTLTASMMGDRVMLTDAKGGMSHVTQADVYQSNGVIHVTDAVFTPAAS